MARAQWTRDRNLDLSSRQGPDFSVFFFVLSFFFLMEVLGLNPVPHACMLSMHSTIEVYPPPSSYLFNGNHLLSC